MKIYENTLKLLNSHEKTININILMTPYVVPMAVRGR